LKNNDKVGLVMFADKVLHFYRPRKGKSNVLHLLRELIAVQPTGNHTDLLSALEYVNRTQKRRAVVFLLSDFFVAGLLPDDSVFQNQHPTDTPQQQRKIGKMLSGIRERDGSVAFRPGRKRYPLKHQTPAEKALSICARKHDLIAMMLTDKREETFPSVGLITLRDAETGECREVDCNNAQVRQTLTEHFQKVHGHIEAALTRCRVDQLRVESGSNSLMDLRKFFRQRKKRHSK